MKRLTVPWRELAPLLRWRLDHFVLLNLFSIATFAAYRLWAVLSGRGTAGGDPVVVGLDARCLERSLSGIERYVSRLAEHVPAVDPALSFRLYLRGPRAPGGPHEPAPPRPGLPNLSEFAARPLSRLLAAQNRHLAEREVSIFHVTWQDMFWYHNFPLLWARRSVLTIHDLINLNVPDYHPAWERRTYRWILWLACRWADRVIVVSRWGRDDLLRAIPVPAWKIRVIHEAPDERFRERLDPALAAEAARRQGLDGPYFFCLSKTYAHKNLEVLVEGYRRFVARASAPPALFLAGERYWEPTNARLRSALLAPELRGRVVWTGHVPDEDLPALYAASLAFVMPSRYEGFGIPILEAMASGAPVVAARAASLPEVGGEAALYFDPDDPEDLARLLARVASEPVLREGLSRRGREWASRFTWEKCARETLAVYREILIN